MRRLDVKQEGMEIDCFCWLLMHTVYCYRHQFMDE